MGRYSFGAITENYNKTYLKKMYPNPSIKQYMVMTVLITYIKREKARNLEYNAH
jgi:hypothetical protein